jgi:hypothetical protein
MFTDSSLPNVPLNYGTRKEKKMLRSFQCHQEEKKLGWRYGLSSRIPKCEALNSNFSISRTPPAKR